MPDNFVPLPAAVLQAPAAPNVVPSRSSGNPVESSANTILQGLNEQYSNQQKAVQEAQANLIKLSPYSSSSSAQPVMPPPRRTPFDTASIHNLDNVHPTTAGGARSKAIGQIAAQAGSFVGEYFKKKEAEKTQALAQDINRSLELQKGMDEAKTILQGDPNNQQAKMQLQKNQTQLQALLSGKNGKEIFKAYDITFGEGAKKDAEDKHKDPAHQAMQQAMKQHQEEEKLKAFEEGQPQRMGANPAYEQKAAELKQQMDVLKQMDSVYGKVMPEIIRANTAAQNNASREAIASSKNLTELDKVAKTHSNRMLEIDRRGQIERQNISNQRDNAAKLKASELWYTTSTRELEDSKRDLKSLTETMDKLTSKATDDPSIYAGSKADLGKAIEAKQAEINKLAAESRDALGMMQGDPEVQAAREAQAGWRNK